MTWLKPNFCSLKQLSRLSMHQLKEIIQAHVDQPLPPWAMYKRTKATSEWEALGFLEEPRSPGANLSTFRRASFLPEPAETRCSKWSPCWQHDSTRNSIYFLFGFPLRSSRYLKLPPTILQESFFPINFVAIRKLSIIQDQLNRLRK